MLTQNVLSHKAFTSGRHSSGLKFIYGFFAYNEWRLWVSEAWKTHINAISKFVYLSNSHNMINYGEAFVCGAFFLLSHLPLQLNPIQAYIHLYTLLLTMHALTPGWKSILIVMIWYTTKGQKKKHEKLIKDSFFIWFPCQIHIVKL